MATYDYYYNYQNALDAAGGDVSKLINKSTTNADYWQVKTSNNVNTTSKTIWVADIQEKEHDLGFDPIPVCRPQFIKFTFDGLKPNTLHYFFVNNRNMTTFTSTNATQISNYDNAARGDEYRDPGERYISKTSWPLASGSGSTLTSDSNGNITGIFYLQRNSTVNFPTGNLTMNVCDVANNNILNALSYASTTFSAGGTVSYGYYQAFNAGNIEVTNPDYVEPVPPTPPTPPSNSGSSVNQGTNNNNNDHDNRGDNSNVHGFSYSLGADGYVYTHTDGNGEFSDLGDAYAAQSASKADGGNGQTQQQECVIATHAVSNGAFTKYEKARAVVWCENVLHDKWWGDIIRRGYRHLGRQRINNGTAHKYYRDFKDYIDFGRGKNRTIKNGLKFISYTTRFFFAGVFLASKND